MTLQQNQSQIATQTSSLVANNDVYYQFPHIEKRWDKQITASDIRRSDGLMSDVRTQCMHEWMRSRQATLDKRDLFKEWIKKMRKPDAGVASTIKSFTLLAQLKAFIATFHDSELTVSFTGREFTDDELAYAIEQNAKYDQKSMLKGYKDHPYLTSIAQTGTGLRVKNGWNPVTKLIEYKVIDTKYWYPDTQGNIFDGYRYHGFDIAMSKLEMNQINLRCKDEVYFDFQNINLSINVDYESGRQAEDKASGADSTWERRGQAQLHNRYTQIGNRKYITTWANQFSTLIRFEPIEPITKSERDHPETIPWGVNVGQVMPMQGDPWGMGLFELMIDFQNAKNRLLNLALVKEERNAGFRQFLVDISKVPNLSTLEKRSSEGPTYIPTKPGNNGIGDAVVPIGDDRPDQQSTMGMMQKLDSEVQDIGFTNIARGVQPDSTATATENKIQQQNSNLMFSLDADMLSFSEQDFWKNIWFRGLKEYMTEYDKKRVRIGNGLASTTYELKRNDILSMQDPDIEVESKKVRLERDKQMLTYLTAREPLVMQDPDMPKIAKLMYRRDLDQLAGLPREKVYRNTPRTHDEDRALIYYHILNKIDEIKEKDPKYKIKNLFTAGMDNFTYYIYLSNAKDSPEKRDIVNQLRKRMMDEGQQKAMQSMQGAPGSPASPLGGIANSMGAQMTGSLVKQQQSQQGGMQAQGTK